MEALIWLGKGGKNAIHSRMNEQSRSCAERQAQAEAGPLMLMMRRANMGFP
jgi:hypothetical protein